jgi:hypothetical protein
MRDPARRPAPVGYPRGSEVDRGKIVAALRVEQALEELRDRAGTQFDPQVVSALERILG